MIFTDPMNERRGTGLAGRFLHPARKFAWMRTRYAIRVVGPPVFIRSELRYTRIYPSRSELRYTRMYPSHSELRYPRVHPLLRYARIYSSCLNYDTRVFIHYILNYDTRVFIRRVLNYDTYVFIRYYDMRVFIRPV